MFVTLGINGFGACGRSVFFAALATQLRATTTTAAAETTMTAPCVTVVAINDALQSTVTMAHLIAHEAAQHGLPGLTVEVTSVAAAVAARARDAQANGEVAHVRDALHNVTHDNASDVHGSTDCLLLGRARIAVVVTHTHDYRAIGWGRWPHCIVVECSGVCTTRERCGVHCVGARGAAGVVIAAQSVDAPLVVPAVTHSAPQQLQLTSSSGGVVVGRHMTPAIVCAGDAVEAAVAPLLHALVTHNIAVHEVHYTAMLSARVHNGVLCSSSGSGSGGGGSGEAAARASCPLRLAHASADVLDAIVPCGCRRGDDDLVRVADNASDNSSSSSSSSSKAAAAAALAAGMAMQQHSDKDSSVLPLRQPSTLEQALPTLRGRVTGACYQVPVRRGCAVDVVVRTSTAVTRRQLHDVVVAAATTTTTVDESSGSHGNCYAEWLVVQHAAVTHVTITGNKSSSSGSDSGGGAHYISTDCLGDARVLCELASTQVASGCHAHRLLLWVDLECNYAARLLAIAAALTARITVPSAATMTVTP